MAYKITFDSNMGVTEDVNAESYADAPPWIDFYDGEGERVLRVKASDVERIDLKK